MDKKICGVVLSADVAQLTRIAAASRGISRSRFIRELVEAELERLRIANVFENIGIFINKLDHEELANE